MSNMFTGTEVEKEPSFFIDLKEDIEEETKTFGATVRVIIDIKSRSGNVWVQFADQTGASKCRDFMNSRFYEGNKILCYFVT